MVLPDEAVGVEAVGVEAVSVDDETACTDAGVPVPVAMTKK
jgi:hypothetical protein